MARGKKTARTKTSRRTTKAQTAPKQATTKSTPRAPRSDLNERELRFVDAFMGPAEGNGAKAASLAGYAAGSARITASKLLTKANVQAAINLRREALSRASIA